MLTHARSTSSRCVGALSGCVGRVLGWLGGWGVEVDQHCEANTAWRSGMPKLCITWKGSQAYYSLSGLPLSAPPLPCSCTWCLARAGATHARSSLMTLPWASSAPACSGDGHPLPSKHVQCCPHIPMRLPAREGGSAALAAAPVHLLLRTLSMCPHVHLHLRFAHPIRTCCLALLFPQHCQAMWHDNVSLDWIVRRCTQGAHTRSDIGRRGCPARVVHTLAS